MNSSFAFEQGVIGGKHQQRRLIFDSNRTIVEGTRNAKAFRSLAKFAFEQGVVGGKHQQRRKHQKRNLSLIKGIKKQIDKFELKSEDLVFTNNPIINHLFWH